MNILMIHQHFATEGEDAAARFFQIGRRLLSHGDKVTVITGRSKLALSLDGKKIGLLQKDGMAVIVLNIPYDRDMNFMGKCFALIRYAWKTYRQGRRLPRPEMIIVASPPLTAAYAAVLLSRRYDAPLILQLGELWPEALIRRGALTNKVVISLARRVEEKVYRSASSIIVGAQVAADTIRQTIAPGRLIHILSEDLPEEIYTGRFQEILSEARGRVLK